MQGWEKLKMGESKTHLSETPTPHSQHKEGKKAINIMIVKVKSRADYYH